MGGDIWVEGEPGQESVFSFTARFELATYSAAALIMEAPVVVDFRSIHGARVLVVDDNRVNLQITGLLLAQAGLLVTTAANGREAVTAVEQSVEPFDVILMDIQMPVMDGYEATRRIREQ